MWRRSTRWARPPLRSSNGCTSSGGASHKILREVHSLLLVATNAITCNYITEYIQGVTQHSGYEARHVATEAASSTQVSVKFPAAMPATIVIVVVVAQIQPSGICIAVAWIVTKVRIGNGQRLQLVHTLLAQSTSIVFLLDQEHAVVHHHFLR
jgi:hypothetical protein